MSFFHNLNKTLDSIAARPEAAQLNERDEGKPGKNFEKIAKGAAERYGSKEAGERVAGAVRAKLAKAGKLEEESVDEGLVDVVKKVGGMAKKAGGAVLNKVGHGDDVDMIRDLQRKMGMPPTGEKPKQVKEKVDQKAFAALAEPKDKITFADKIAGAKKEVDEMLGDVAAEAMRNALGNRQQVADEGNAFTGKLKATAKGGKFKMGNKEYTDTSGVDESYDDEDDVYAFQDPAKKKTHKTATGGTVTRHGGVTRHQAAPGHYGGFDPETDPDKDDDKPGTPAGEKRGRGRPKGAPKGPERVTAKAYKHKGERKVKEGDMDEGADQGQAQQIYNDLADIRAMAKQAQGGSAFPQGFASRLEATLWAAMTMIKNQQSGDAQVREAESTDKKDNRAERAGKRVTKDIEYDEKKKDGIHGKKRGAEDSKAERAGKRVAKDIEYDEKKDDGKKDEPKKSKSKFKFGGSVYEALDAQLETLITEGMGVTINMNKDSEDGHPGNKSITVNADGEDAERLAELLKMAGVSQHEETCSSCGQADCGCDMIDENDPNWPTDTETSDNALQYSGGLNGPKATGQTTIPVIAGQEERMGEDDLSRLREMAGMRQDSRLDEGMMDKIKGMLVPKLMKLLGPDAEKIASAVKQATGGDFTPSKENAMKVVQALGIDKAAEQGQSPQMAEGIAGNWQGKLIQALYTLGLLGSAGAAASMWHTVGGSWFTAVGVLLLMFANTFFSSDSGMVGAMGHKGNTGVNTANKGPASLEKDNSEMPTKNTYKKPNVLGRQVSMEESAKVEQNLLNLYRTFGK